MKSPSWKEDWRKREEKGRSVRLHLREFRANGKRNNPGQRKMPTIPVVPLSGARKMRGVYLSRRQSQVSVDEESYILPQLQESVGGAGQKMRGVHSPPKRQEKYQWEQSGRLARISRSVILYLNRQPCCVK